MTAPTSPQTPAPPSYRWTRIALVCVALFFAACVLFMAKEVRRVKRIRVETEDMRKSTLPTNAPAPPAAR